jgi:phenylacetate-CoA ligase
VGDVGIAGMQTECSCGRHFDRMAMIQGRNTDVVITPSGNRLIVHFFTGILEFFPEIDEFQVVQEYPGEIVLRFVPKLPVSSHTVQYIIATLKERGASDMKIEVELVDNIPLSTTGKRRFIINNTRLS